MSRVYGLLCNALPVCAIALAVALAPGGAIAKKRQGAYAPLYSFCSQPGCTDGAFPDAGLVMDGSGNLYGTTQGGQGGSIFKLAPDGTETVLYTFCSQANCADGATSRGGLIVDGAGNLYGTTLSGGAGQGGTVFKLAPDGTYTVLYSFCSQQNCSDGASPYSGLIMDGSGNLYGTTTGGGPHRYAGTVFKIAPDGTETVLYSFCSQVNCTDGGYPQAGLIMDNSGNLYGTTGGGGNSTGAGTVFELTPDGTENVLYSFCSQNNCADGSNPQASLVMDNSGNLYGTTGGGGLGHCQGGCGTVFEVTPSGSESVLYSFCSLVACTDGAFPYLNNNLVMDSTGNLFGMTTSYGKCRFGSSTTCGAVFELARNGGETVLYNFCAKRHCTDGFLPYGGLVMDSSGSLYGTASQGGDYYSGVVFKIR
ncbi:MAG: hypothetical protein JO208_05485 [Alphaproteobacteria bacterium]|nr:hypothetical protein [Alphaproteobacteria bacterium]